MSFTSTGGKGGSAKHAAVFRDKLTAFYLTEQDASYLREIAHRGGFRSTSHLVTAIVEPLCLGAFSLTSWVRNGARIQKHMESRGVRFTADWSSLVGLLKLEVPPAIPEEPISIEQLKADLQKVVQVIADEQAKPHKPKKSK